MQYNLLSFLWSLEAVDSFFFLCLDEPDSLSFSILSPSRSRGRSLSFPLSRSRSLSPSLSRCLSRSLSRFRFFSFSWCLSLLRPFSRCCFSSSLLRLWDEECNVLM